MKMPTKKKLIKKKKKKTKQALLSIKSKHKRVTRVRNTQGRSIQCATGSSEARPSKQATLSQKIKTIKNNAIDAFRTIPRFDYANNALYLVKVNKNSKKMSYQGQSSPNGLSPKDKSFLISSCQSRSHRYQKLKVLAANAIKENKVFCVYGTCNAVRKALIERGWVEKIPPEKMNLAKLRNGSLNNKAEIHGELERLLLSNLVEKAIPNFIWRTKDEQRDTSIDMNKECTTIVNKLKTDALWTTKQGLCSTLKSNYWFYIEDVAEVNSPRTYNSYDLGEIDAFIQDYKVTACTSLLKWVLSMVANDRPVFVESGKVSMNVVIFALNRCKEYLFMKQNKDIDRPVSNVNSGQWNAFLKKYYLIIARDQVFQADNENKLPLYTSYANFLLKEMHRYRPQMSCEGCHNIWIIKPAHNSRGRGIRMASKLAVITNLLHKVNSKYVVQKYIEEPLLIHDTKFDIRQYYLVTSTYPLVIWMYRDCYLKFSSQKYSLKNYHESIHLTNNAVQRHYANCTGRHPDLPQNNMWDSDKYKDYLKRKGKNKVWDNIIYPGMRKSIIGIMLSCQDSLSVCKNRFELYGCDFILDKEYKPWLIEINSCPDLNHTTLVTAKICPAVISDIIKVIVDHPNDPNAATGKFECIYRQPMTIPRYSQAADLYIKGYSLPVDYFYKGNIQIKESLFDDADIGKETNIKAILDKLKHRFDDDSIMIEPEDDSISIDRKYELKNTESEYELSAVATVITEQLDELMDRITSEHTFSLTTHDVQSLHSTIDSSNLMKNSISATDIRAIMKKTINKLASTQAVASTSFEFSGLDDGPMGKGSFIDIESLKNIFNDFSKLNNDNKKSQDGVLVATAKMIHFINKKQEEYLR